MTKLKVKTSELGQIEDHLPHLEMPTPDGKVRMIPVSVFYRILSGETKITDIDGWEMITRKIIGEWLQVFGLAKQGTTDWGDDE